MKVKPKKKSREEIADPRNAIYHFKIYLLNISPMIYRRFKIKGDTHIAQLHHLIHIIMGWDNDHLHSFKTWEWDIVFHEAGEWIFTTYASKMG